MDDHFNYYVADSRGLTSQVLGDMEAAGTSVLASLEAIDLVREFAVPMKASFSNGLNAIVVVPLPSIIPHTPQFLADVARQFSVDCMDPAFFENPKIITGDVPIPMSARAKLSEILDKMPTALAALEDIAKQIVRLGINPNLAVQIAGYAEVYNRPLQSNPQDAVLTLNGNSFYPEARKIWAHWVLKVPPRVTAAGVERGFVPPDCTPIDFKAMQSMLTVASETLSFNDFAHNHQKARERILNLPKLDFGNLNR